LKKVLIIDDEQSITRLLKFALEKTGLYAVSMENEGEKAMAAIRSVNPDVLILDVNLPGMSGGEIAAALKEDGNFSKLPIIFLTGNISEDEVQAGLTISGHPAMAKPINMDKLLKCIATSIK
jgi:DNA-binding response OmpR family regulator